MNPNELNIPDLGPREQYRYRIAQTAAQLGLDQSAVDAITSADTEDLQLYEQALLADGDPRENLARAAAGAAFNNENWFERNVGAPVGSGLGRVFHELSRPLNAVTGFLTEAQEAYKQDFDLNPFNNNIGEALGAGLRGAWRGADYDEHYGTRTVLQAAGEDVPAVRRLQETPVVGPVLEFAGDVALDPLNFLGIRAIRPGGNRVDEAADQARRFVAESTNASELEQFRALPINQRGPIVEDIIKDAFTPYNARRGARGRFRSPNVRERATREATEVFDPVLNRGVSRPDWLPETAPKGYQARERLVEMILEKDDLHRLRTGEQTVRLDNYLQRHSRLAQNGFLSVRLGGQEIIGDNPVTRGLFRAGAGVRHAIGYKPTGDARRFTRLFAFGRRDTGEVAEHFRRAQGNYAGWGEASLHDLGNARRLVTNDEMDQIVDALDSLKNPKIDPETVWEQLDQIPLQKGGIVGSPVDGLTEIGLETVGDVGRFYANVMDTLTNLERAVGVRALDEHVPLFPVRPKGGRTLSAAEQKMPISELKARNIKFDDPLTSLADNVSYRLANLAGAEAQVLSLEQYAIRIRDPRATMRKVQPRDAAKAVKRTSQTGSRLEDIVLGDMQPTTQELLRGGNPIVEPGVNPIVGPNADSYLETPEGMAFAKKVAEEAKRRGSARVGLMEFVPVTKVKSPIVKQWLKQDNIRTTDILLPRPIAEAIDQMDRFVRSPTEAGALLRSYDQAMSVWKKAVTVYNPGYHVRNSFSDYFMNVAAGVRGPQPYQKAMRVITNRFRHNEGAVQEVMKPLQALGDSTRGFVRGERINFAGQQVRADAIWHLYARYSGAKSGQIRAELTNIIDRAATQRKRPGAALTRFSEGREDYMRLAHFIDRFEKQAAKRRIRVTDNGVLTAEARKLSQEVGDKIRMYNLDYGAKTPFERDVMSRIIPFYTYLRKNLPLQVQLMLTQPGMIAKYPKYKNLFEGLMGNPEEDDSTVLIPDWIQRSFPWVVETESRRNSGPIGQLLSMFGAGGDSGAVVMPMESMMPIGSLNEFASITDPLMQGRLPRMDEVSRQFAQTLSGTNPALRVPFEIAAGEQLFTGQELNDPGDWLKYALGQIPVGRLSGAAVMDGPSGVQDDFMRWLTGLPIRQVTPVNEQSEFRRREDALEAVRGNVLSEVNAELREAGYEEVTSLPALDPDELIMAIIAAAERRRRPIQYSEEYLTANG
jgi:hypothetical protein